MQRLFLLCWLVIPLCLKAQLSPEEALKTLDDKYAQEKLHIFTDREEYAAGESIWFKAYLFSGNVKSFISSTVYLELFTSDGVMVSKMSVPMWYAVGNGSLHLPQSLEEGVYYLRAYTKWMLNFDPSFQYYASILVYNSTSKRKIAKAPVKWKAAVYPESGRLLAGEENKVAIRLKSMGSLPGNWSGILVNAKDPAQPILHFTSLTADVAAFLFTPEINNVYQVHIKDDYGNESAIDLVPEVSGILLRAEQLGKEVYVDMIFKGLPEAGLNYKLVAHMQQQLVVNSVIRKKQEVVKTSIPIDNLMTGILHLTVFDPNGNAVAERLVFVDKPAGDFKVHATSGDMVKPSTFSFTADTSDFFNYAISVTSDANATARKRNIFSDIWFGDLQQIPENGSAYFSGKAEDILARDALLITETWKRFQWQDVLKNKFPVIANSAENYFSYRGTAKRNGKAIGNEMLTLMLRFPDSSLQFLQTRTNEFGEFDLNNIVFYDTLKVYYQPSKGKKADVDIYFERTNSVYTNTPGQFPASSFYLVDRLINDTVPRVIANAIQQLKEEQRSDAKYLGLEEVKVSAERKTKKELLNQSLASPLFQTQNEVVLDIMNEEPGIQAYRTIFDWLDGRVPGLQFRIVTENDVDLVDPITQQVDPAILGQRIPMMRDQKPSLFIDEMPTDWAGVMALPTSEIAMVKVIKGYFVGANSGGAGGGAIAIYTRKAGLNKAVKSTLPSALMVGYSAYKPFIVPENTGSVRNLILWSSLLLPQEEGGVFINLPQSTTGSRRIILTGFTSSAEPVYKELVLPGK